MKNIAKVAVVASLMASAGSYAAVSQVDFVNSITPILDNVGNPLLPGTSIDGDGDLIQIGYFSGDTATFSGDWIPITGLGSANPTLLTSIGDGGDSTSFGIFSGSILFDTTDPASSSALPTGGTQLAIRFYNDTTEATATHYNTVTSSDLSWEFPTPSTPQGTPAALDMDGTTLVWEDALNPFMTTIPEPASAALGLLSGLFLLRRRR